MSQPNSISRAMISRLILGVTSIGAAIGFIYVIYNQRKKDSASDSGTTPTSSLSSRKKKRISSGERNRVTFAEENEIIGIDASNSPTVSKDQLEEKEKIEKEIKILPEGSPIKPPEFSPTTCTSPGELSQPSSSVPEVEDNQSSIEVVKEISQPLVEQSNGPTSNGHEIQKQQAITPETDYDRTSVVRELRLNRDHIPGIIGRKGSNIKAIQSSSNTIINFRDETLENGDRVCIIRGEAQAVSVAESLIEKFIMEQPIITFLVMHVPVSSVGRIIGKGGESIRSIQEMSKAKVVVDSNNQFPPNRGGSAGDVRMVPITLRGTEDQIKCAKEIIIEKVEEEKTLRRNIDIVTQNRASRRPANPSSPTSTSSTNSGSSNSTNGNHSAYSSFPSTKSGTLEVFVSCAYHPNDFWIQVMGRESIDLDKLTDAMTDFYSQIGPETFVLNVNEVVAAPFDVDGKMYRGKILKLENDSAEVCYVDYGDKRIIPQSSIRRIQPEFLRLRFQAMQATLNLGCTGERWDDEVIAKFCDLTYCAQWRRLIAKVKDWIKPSIDSKEAVMWVELSDKNINIGNELINLGLATANDSLPSFTENSSHISSNKSRSYAAVVADETQPNLEVLPSEEGAWDDSVNGN